MKFKNPYQVQLKEDLMKTQYNTTVKKSKAKRKSWKKQQKKICHIWQNIHKAIHRFLNRNLAGLERKGCYIQSTKWKKQNKTGNQEYFALQR